MEEAVCGHFMQEIKNVIFDNLHFYGNFIGECYWQNYFIVTYLLLLIFTH